VKFAAKLWSTAAVVGLTSFTASATASPSLVAADGHGADKQLTATASGWRDGGRISVRRDVLIMDGSTSHVIVAVATTNSTPQHPGYLSTISRRTPDGNWIRQTSDIGSPVGVDVNADGDAVIISTSGLDDGDLIATRWPRGADQARSSVILRAEDLPAQYTSTQMSANGRGDVAVLVVPYEGTGERTLLLRKPSGQPWKPTLSIRPARYDGALDAVDITPTGAVVGAFTQDKTLSVRTLQPGSATFGPPTLVTTRTSELRYGITVEVGVNGDLATTSAYDNKFYASNIRLNIVPANGEPWHRDFITDGGFSLATVGRDGSVVIQKGIDTRRWDPQSRSFTGSETSFFKDDNEQGDVLIGGGIYKGSLQLWPVGQPRGPKVDSPRGDQRAVVLTGDHLVYVATLREDTTPDEYRLSIRQF
jgi:hypothetical protein